MAHLPSWLFVDRKINKACICSPSSGADYCLLWVNHRPQGSQDCRAKRSVGAVIQGSLSYRSRGPWGLSWTPSKPWAKSLDCQGSSLQHGPIDHLRQLPSSQAKNNFATCQPPRPFYSTYCVSFLFCRVILRASPQAPALWEEGEGPPGLHSHYTSPSRVGTPGASPKVTSRWVGQRGGLRAKAPGTRAEEAASD